MITLAIMMRKTLFLLVAMACLPACGFSQINLGSALRNRFSAASDSVLINAVMPGLYVVRQQYQIRSNADGKLYGKDGNNWFGETYSLGVKVAGGLLVDRRVMQPWADDVDFSKINNHGKYVPQLYRTTYLRPLDGEAYREANLDFDTPEYMEAYGTDSLLYRHIEAQADFGFLTDERFGTADGYMLWAYRDSTASHAGMRVKLRVARKQLGNVADSLSVDCLPPDAGTVLGGVFIVPVVDRVGQITCRLAGMALPASDGRWVLRSLTREAASGTPRKNRRNRSGRDAGQGMEQINMSPVEP